MVSYQLPEKFAPRRRLPMNSGYVTRSSASTCVRLGAETWRGERLSTWRQFRSGGPFGTKMLVTVAAMRGVALGVTRLLLGTVKGDSLHADGRREFIAAMDTVLRLQEGGLVLEAPAIDLTAAELIRLSGAPWELLAWSHSCHVSEYACGVCRGCHKHYQTCEAIGVDPY